MRLSYGWTLVLCLCAPAYAQQLETYPDGRITIEEGAYICTSKELIVRTLEQKTRIIRYGDPIFIMPNGCQYVRNERPVRIHFEENYSTSYIVADILRVEFLDAPSQGTQYFTLGAERILFAVV